MADRLGDAQLNRALLARQGLLERMEVPVVDAVEAIGAVQAQHWPAPRAALWTRVAGVEAADVYRALDRRELVTGSLLRGTIHLVSAREHPAYAAVAEASGALDWRRVDTSGAPSAVQLELPAGVAAHCAEPRSADELVAVAEAWVQDHPGALSEAELARQREYAWRPVRSTAAFVRAPGSGACGPLTPPALAAAPGRPGDVDLDAALDCVVRRHLRAFGPAGADDVAQWIGWKVPPVRAALERLAGELERFEDSAGRTLYDLPDAPRPDPDGAPPPGGRPPPPPRGPPPRAPRRSGSCRGSTACCSRTRPAAAAGSCPTSTATPSTTAGTSRSARASSSTASSRGRGRSRRRARRPR